MKSEQKSIADAQREAEIAQTLGIPSINVCVVGSTLICGRGNDLDLLALIHSDEALVKAGFKPDLEQPLYKENGLTSWRKGGVNVIAVFDRALFVSEAAIAHAARAAKIAGVDMSERDRRVAFHGAVRRAIAERHRAST